jgi:hypothetical protein
MKNQTATLTEPSTNANDEYMNKTYERISLPEIMHYNQHHNSKAHPSGEVYQQL